MGQEQSRMPGYRPLIIRGLSIGPPLLLAPMAGLTHSALRTTIQGFGGVGLLSTEMLAAWRLPRESPRSPFLVRTPGESPLSYQLLVNDPELVEPAIHALEPLGAEMIDFNLGCPAPRVRKSGGGCRLVAKPELVRAIIRRARRATELPLSAKIRIGERLEEAPLKALCTMLEDEGVDLLTVHARLHKEAFCRKPRWEWVARVKEWLSIPVIANGGVDSVASARQCLEESGADGLMIGRAAAARPWIFAEISAALYSHGEQPVVSLPGVYHAFAQGLVDRFRPERRLGRLKEFSHYFAENYPFGHHLASRVQSSRSVAEALTRAGDFFRASDAEELERLRLAQGQAFMFEPGD
ncbi:tRNA dihydrouridine synthase [Desulfogranum mediterraneum]|uniref:tRNA dihydrouridine synthase n=1 Tax=Desulfogranum mediterraneum TaxID=160661 RepID=UPI00040E926A|nr:tRNA-dihydrouridine synthase family protein [Desulfogranum mediterraneum]